MSRGSTATQLEAVTSDIIERARAAGHELVCISQPFGPWYITAGLRSRTPFGPFATQAEAEGQFPQMLREHARCLKLGGDYDAIRERDKQWRVYLRVGKELGPFPTCSAALDAAEEEARKDATAHAAYVQRLAKERMGIARIPAAFQEIRLDEFCAKTDTLRAALEIGREYVETFPTLRQGLLLCGAVDRGKTSLGCAVASALALAGYAVLYLTPVDIITAHELGRRPDGQAYLSAPELLVVDWSGLEASTSTKADRNLAEVVGALSARAIASSLAEREADGRPTLLIADCDREALRRYLGTALFEKLSARCFKSVDF